MPPGEKGGPAAPLSLTNAVLWPLIDTIVPKLLRERENEGQTCIQTPMQYTVPCLIDIHADGGAHPRSTSATARIFGGSSHAKFCKTETKKNSRRRVHVDVYTIQCCCSVPSTAALLRID